MICPSCNKENYDGASFCVNCGANLTNVPRNTNPTPPPPPPPPQNPYEYKDPLAVNNINNPYNPPTPPPPQQFAQDQFQAPPPPPPPVNNPGQPTVGPQEAEKINKTAKKLAIISLCLLGGNFVLSIIGVILSGMLSYLADYSSYSSYSYGASGIIGLGFNGLGTLCYFASIILAIIAKVKVSSKKLKNTFVNVVFWVQMGLIIASVVLVVVLVVALAAACGAMIESC